MTTTRSTATRTAEVVGPTRGAAPAGRVTLSDRRPLSGWTRRIVTVVGAFVVALAMTLGVAAPASAYTWTYGAGRPGNVSVPATAGVQIWYVAPGALRGQQVPGIRVNGPTAYRSPASTGTQYVGYGFNIERWSGTAWGTVYRSFQQYGTLTGNTPVRFSDQEIRIVEPGHYRVYMVFSWQAGNGAIVGSSTLIKNQKADYFCFSGPCAVGAGWISL